MSWKRAVITKLNRVPLFRNHVYVAQHGPARGLKRQGGMGWLPSIIHRSTIWEAEEAFLDALDWTGKTVYDVGGDQGIYTLFFAKHVGATGRVIAFEPNPESYQRIITNLSLNNFTNVQVLLMGLGEREEVLRFTFPVLEPARGSAEPAISEQISEEKGVHTFECRVNALDAEVKASQLPPPDFVKIDVEGLEMGVLRGMKEILIKHHPALFIEIHGAHVEEKIANVRQVVGFLEELGFTMLHVETGQKITSANADISKEGHLYCTANDH